MTEPARETDVDPIDVYACGGCAEEHRTGRETFSGYHTCGLGRWNSFGGSPEYHRRYVAGSDAAIAIAVGLFGWMQ